MSIEKMAEFFHDTYEQLAPRFGYKTRIDTKEFNKESPNGRLMMAVCNEMLHKQHIEERDSIWCIVNVMEELRACLEEIMYLSDSELPRWNYNNIIDQTNILVGELKSQYDNI